MQKSFHVANSSIYPLGVCFIPEGLHISAVCEEHTDCGIILYDRRHKEGIRIPFPPDGRKGNICAMLLEGYQDRDCSYLFYQGERIFQDEYAFALKNERKYGEEKEPLSRCKVLDHTYHWEGDKAPLIPFEESIFYLLHVRGFTKHRTSGVQAKGTYAGIVEKIPYLQELGITAVLLMPAYEFDEVLKEDKEPLSMEQMASSYRELQEETEPEKPRLNYWGYQEGLYFLPKYSYAYGKDAVTEFKDMVKALHRQGIEVMMQFYFPPTVSYAKMLDILKHWVLEYHIDGFHLMGADIPMHMLRKEPLFAETKLIGEKDDYSPVPGGYGSEDKERHSKYRNFGFMNDMFLYDMRKVLKGDANMLDRLIYLCKKNAADKGVVNCIARQDGFRLCDLVSYNEKHNEANGEGNEDGNTENFSWNCGVEGKTKKKNILSLRMRQMKNALTFVMISQGTPLLYGGDEFANTQEGNNNPYCQDNSICWIKWNLLKTNEELFQYTKELIALRKAHSILHMAAPLKGLDYRSLGYPDISFHGQEAWIPRITPESRSLGILFCGSYGKENDEKNGTLLYIGVNMHWEAKTFGLPQIAKDKKWTKVLSTDSKEAKTSEEEEITQRIVIPPRTIHIYVTGENAEGRRKEKSVTRKKIVKGMK
ncbi:MAG: alpha-amylase family glycosyl hydrolase [Muribaculaceae bacterium]|nr:alpha-amylase family glycosyl hydrolase [Muribaculaceae bacterium]